MLKFQAEPDRADESGTAVAAEIRRYVQQPFGLFAELVGMQARLRPKAIALTCGAGSLTYRKLLDQTDRIAASLQRDGVVGGGTAAICAASSLTYLAAFLGVLRTGAAVSPLSPSSTPGQLLAMLQDSGASHLFVDTVGLAALAPVLDQVPARCVAMDEAGGVMPIAEWLLPDGARPVPVAIGPAQPFNIIYSSGTTGTPKGIVQPHAMRWPQLYLVDPPGYGPHAVTIISTPLYSNTTLVSLLPALAGGGQVVLMQHFEARSFLELSERHRATMAMLVPAQYRRILDVPDFDRYDLSSYHMKFATSAPFPAELKAEVLARWPGGLIEYFGMTEGGASCLLAAHEHPDKLHTVGRPIPGHEMLIVDEAGRVLPTGEAGEIVGRSAAMMTGYHNLADRTAEAEWRDAEGRRYMRTGDLGRFDADGFLTVVGRKKDVIISGGLNIHPVDLETALRTHPAVREAAVVGAPSRRWGEAPVGFVTLAEGTDASAAALAEWANQRLGKMQRLAEVRILDEMPCNALGKILKHELRQLCLAQPAG